MGISFLLFDYESEVGLLATDTNWYGVRTEFFDSVFKSDALGWYVDTLPFQDFLEFILPYSSEKMALLIGLGRDIDSRAGKLVYFGF
jgi:hypothetical protein